MKQNGTGRTAFFMLILSCTAASCSLKYEKEMSFENASPELQFQNVRFMKYEGESLSAEIRAELLEQYKGDGKAYARNAHFKTWDKSGSPGSEGSCGLLGMNSQDELYTLFGSIELSSSDPEFSIRAQELKWNKKTQQLVSGQDSTVFLSRDDIEIEGKGFSASGISRSFSFSRNTAGTITADSGAESQSGADSE